MCRFLEPHFFCSIKFSLNIKDINIEKNKTKPPVIGMGFKCIFPSLGVSIKPIFFPIALEKNEKKIDKIIIVIISTAILRY